MNTLLTSGIHFIFRRCIAPLSDGEDNQRHEFILNVILFGSILLIGFLDIFIVISKIREGVEYHGIPFVLFTILLAVFVGLLVLSRSGYFSLTAYILLSLYYLSATYCIVRWGVELPLAGFGYALLIITSSILVSTRFAFFATSFIALTLLGVGFLQMTGHITPMLFWKHELIDMEDPAELSIIFFVIMTISWLSNREMEASLRRARHSEKELTKERNSLEIKVDERTRELKQLQQEKLTQLYRFAEFGRLSSGIFHDLMNSMTTVVTTVEGLEHRPEKLPEVKRYLDKAVTASKRMSEFIATARKQMQTKDEDGLFSLNKEIRDAIDILEHRAQEINLTIKLKDRREIITYGSALKFHQVAVNLIANAIDAYDTDISGNKMINVSLSKNNETALFRVTDYGAGIPAKILDKIFDPFFTTKDPARGIGLGLSTTKSVIEKEFNGTIAVRSEEGHGASFTITFPIRDEKQNELTNSAA